MGCTWIGWCALPAEAQAAWAQAVLSVMAIVFAAWIAGRRERRELARKLDVYVNLISMAESRATSIQSPPRRGAESREALADPSAGHLEYFQTYVEAFRAIHLHDLPDYRMLPVIEEARRACEELAAVLEVMERYRGTDFPDRPSDALTIRKARHTLARSYAKAADICNDVAVPTLRQRARHIWFLIRNSRFWRR